MLGWIWEKLTSGVNVAVTPLLLAEVLQGAVGGVKGQQFWGAGATEGLAQLEQGGAQVEEERVGGVRLHEDLGHLVGPDLGAAGVGLQAASKPGEQQVAGVPGLLQEIPQDLAQLLMVLSHELPQEGRRAHRGLCHEHSRKQSTQLHT